jgi:hypothetical protein
MKNLTSISIALLLGAISAHANIGDTYEYSCKRYGKPAGTKLNQTTKITEVVWYIEKKNAHWTYVASFNGPGNLCDEVRYDKWSESFTAEDINNILMFNFTSNGGKIIEEPSDNGRYWYNNSGTIFAAFRSIISADNGTTGGYVEVFTAAYIQRDQEAQKAKETSAEPSPSPVPSISDLKPVQM